MSCSSLEKTSLLLKGELAGSEIDRAQAHLETCALCFARLAYAAAELSEEPASQALQPDMLSWLASSGLASPSAEPPSSGRRGVLRLRFPEAATGSIGPYLIEGVVGHGGMGVVYRARHQSGGPQIALKTVNSPDLAAFEGLRQEIRFLKDATQPGIVRVLDYDLSAGDPWYAMELLEGETLADRHLAMWGRHSLPPPSGERPAERSLAGAGQLADILRIYLELCSPLDFIHRVGIVHCDLKPANVFLRDQQHPVLMDFGLVVPARGAVDREALHPAVRRRGTLPYISPEVIDGRIPDARADLYAFGCMLYESITGRPPFSATTRSELYDLHLHAAHTPASRLVTGVPPELDDLLGRLLAKAPQDRIGHAYQVGERLIAVGAHSDKQAATSSPTYLFRSQIVGRVDSVEQVAQALERARHGAGTLVIVEGESGIGKTFFASEIAQRASLLGLRVVTGECQPAALPNDASAAALQGVRNFLDVVRDACRRGGPEITDRLVGNNLGILKQYSPALGGLPGAENYPEPAPLPDTAGRERLLRALTSTLRQFGELRPFVLILDDLQWADELTLALLEALDPAFFATTPLLLLGTRRSNEGSPVLDRLASRSWVTSVYLDRLENDQTAAMIEQMLGLRSPTPSLVEFVATQAEGVPFFVAEYLRTVLADGILSWRDGSWTFDAQSRTLEATLRAVPFPKRLQELVRHRIAGLSKPAKVALQAAAVLGREFESPLLASVLEEADEHTRQIVAEALGRGILELSRDGHPRFVHDKFRESIYADLTVEERRALHARVATTLDVYLRGHPELDVRAGELARHYELASDAANAIDYFERAGQRALVVAADSDAIEHFTQAIKLESGLDNRLDHLRRARWARGIADAKQGLGQASASLQHLSEAAALLGFPVPRAAWLQGVKLGGQLLLQIFRRFTGVTRVTDQTVWQRRIEAGRVFERLARASYYAGETRPLLLGCITSLNLLESTGSAPELAIAYMNVGAVCGILPAPNLVEKYFAMAGQALVETPDPANESLLRMLQAVFYTGAGKADLAISTADNGIAIADLIGFHRRFNECTAVRTGIDIYAGKLASAERGIRQLEASAKLREDVQLTAWANLQRLECLIMKGEIEGAREQFQLTWTSLPDARPEQLWASCLGAFALMRAGDHAAATEMALEGTRHALAGPPVHLHCVDAYDRLTQALLGLCHGAGSRQKVSGATLAKTLSKASQQLKRAARIFPIAQPMAALQLGSIDWLRGKRERAVQTWEAGAVRARELNLPYHEARVQGALAAALAGSERGQASDRRAALLLDELQIGPEALGGTLELLTPRR
jgi:eukaryotic-like serine/threonine-protein kinase